MLGGHSEAQRSLELATHACPVVQYVIVLDINTRNVQSNDHKVHH